MTPGCRCWSCWSHVLGSAGIAATQPVCVHLFARGAGVWLLSRRLLRCLLGVWAWCCKRERSHTRMGPVELELLPL